MKPRKKGAKRLEFLVPVNLSDPPKKACPIHNGTPKTLI